MRGWHNLLSYERIKNKNLLEDEETSNSIALICKYHRNKMPLYGCEAWKDEIFTEISVEPLKKILNSKKIKIYDDKEIQKESVLLVTSILRFIDACDVQSDRVVTPEYRDLREKRTEEEIDYYLTLLEKEENCGIYSLCIISSIPFTVTLKNFLRNIRILRILGFI